MKETFCLRICSKETLATVPKQCRVGVACIWKLTGVFFYVMTHFLREDERFSALRASEMEKSHYYEKRSMNVETLTNDVPFFEAGMYSSNVIF